MNDVDDRAAVMTPVRLLKEDVAEAVFDEAAAIVRAHGLLAIPTESFYALAASAYDAQAVQRVNRLKRRPDGKPLLVLIADRSQLDPLVTEITPAAALLMERFWPGPLTIVFSAAPTLSHALTAETGTVGIRMPAHAALVRVLHRVGPLTGTSANVSGSTPAQTAGEVEATFGAQVDLILDGGQTAGGKSSTVVDVRGPIRLLREGPISRSAIEQALATQGINLS